MSQEIFIMAEQREGTVEEPSFSLLSEGKRLREKIGHSHTLSAIIIGHNVKNPESELGQCGADKVYCFEDRQLERYQPELYTELIAQFIREKDPDFFIFGATSLGSDLAPRIAARLRAGLVTHCVDVIVDRGQLAVVKSISDQYLYQKVVFRNPGLKMFTFSPNALSKEDPDFSKRAVVIRIPPRIDQKCIKAQFIEFIQADPETIGLEEANVVICGGRGVGRQAFDMIYQLADALKGSVGGTRPIIDWGVLPFERQIGQTGIEVFPSVLFAFGVSGANEFTVGIESSKLIVAINIDRKARIFKFADLGIVGDLHKFIPLLIQQIEKGDKSA